MTYENNSDNKFAHNLQESFICLDSICFLGFFFVASVVYYNYHMQVYFII